MSAAADPRGITTDGLAAPEAKRCRPAPDAADACRLGAPATFTELCANDNVTLPLVLNWLDVYSVVRARRVCKTWQVAAHSPLAWSDCTLSVDHQQLLLIPASSVALLRHLHLVHGLKPDARTGTAASFPCLGRMRGLRSLRLVGFRLDAEMCNLLSTHAPNLRELDLSLCREYQDTQQRSDGGEYIIVEPSVLLARGQQTLSSARETSDASTANNDAHDAQDGLYSAVATAASPHVKDAMTHMVLPHAADEQPLPTLRLPLLTSLKLATGSQCRRTLALVASLRNLSSLCVRRETFLGPAADMAVDERHYLTLTNRLFAHTYADTLTHLTLANLNTHGFESYRFELLHKLTHLSLEHSNRDGGVTCAALRAVAALPRLQACEIRLFIAAARVCHTDAWWQALIGVRSLTSLAVIGPDLVMPSWYVVDMWANLHLVLHDPGIRLEALHFDVDNSISLAMNMPTGHPHLRALTLSREVCVASVRSLVQMPRLAKLTITRSRSKHKDNRVLALLRALPNLTAVACNMSQMFGSGELRFDVWMALVSMPALTSLAISGTGHISNNCIDAWCARLRQQSVPGSMRKFITGEADSGAAPSCSALQQLHFGLSTVSADQCGRLLRSLPHLQLMTTYLVVPYAFRPRLINSKGYCAE